MKKIFLITFVLVGLFGVMANEPLVDAIEEGDLDKFVTIVEALDIDLDGYRDEWGRTLCNLAVSKEQLEILTWLEGAGADINQPNNNGSTALSAALSTGNSEITAFLLESGFGVSEKLSIFGMGEGTYYQYMMSLLYQENRGTLLGRIEVLKVLHEHDSSLPRRQKIRLTEDVSTSIIYNTVIDDVEGFKDCLSSNGKMDGVILVAILSDSINVIQLLDSLGMIDWDSNYNSFPYINIWDSTPRGVVEMVGSPLILEYLE